MDRFAIIVDAYHIPFGDSRGFASAFRARGVEPVAVMSTPEPMEAFLPRWFPDDFAAVHYHDGDLDALAATVKGYDPVCIVPGLEPGVELAADLVDRLLPGTGNLPGSAPAHRDKGLMVEALEAHGVPHLRTICSGDARVIAAWLRRHGLENCPLVIKPPKSSGAEDVKLIEAGQDWRPFFDRLIGSRNHYGLVNDRVIIQEFARGPEYIVDLYSVDGRHGLVDVCRYEKYTKDGEIGIYDVADFLPPGHPDVPPLAEYTMQAAHALGIRNGCTHAEVILSPDGPRLVELATRPSGSCMMLSGSLATGDNQVERTVRHHLDGEFTPGYALLQQVRTVWLGAAHEGILRNVESFDVVRDLPTFRGMLIPENGKFVPCTTGMSTSLGWVIQAAPSWAAIETDYRLIKELEGRLVFEQAAVMTGDPS
ncbi:ATP-grasp domain-containing protein [Sphaerisporangium corydalis]|uniref:ATP-grasp domain-containing protein n=1 Tax=Sphaerisporangium corydalis TaxID=1441875 RepID=A0ABV9ENZ4_9ACTN|nr:ATP-grasp domain-containing protein [Sphaerisporangium corydalis]